MSNKNQVSADRLLLEIQKTRGVDTLIFVKRALDIAIQYHEGQKRLSGEPYVIHPINVAYVLFTLGMDHETISAGILHDIIEDTSYTQEMMINEFGQEIAKLVEGVTKISRIKGKQTEAAENFKKILNATIEDPRTMIIKLADKTHNMRTLKYQPIEKQRRIAQEVINLYAPIAGRLGIYKIKSELEDLAFHILHPEEYREIKQRVSAKKSERESYIEKIVKILKTRLDEIYLDAQIDGRAKHFYSIYKKMKQKGKDFEEIFDLTAFRAVTKEMRDCYGALGIIHALWTPVPGRFKDYIGSPKSNDYQSLHTTVIGSDGKHIEFQIRTNGMNEKAEYGIAAHWAYKEGKSTAEEETKQIQWLDRIKPWTLAIENPNQFIEDLTLELNEDEIFVFTPKGRILELPKGATVLDFAFRIHTDVGYHAKCAKISGRICPLRHELKSGDQVEIITEEIVTPSPLWIRYVKTGNAKQKIRQYFKNTEHNFKEIDLPNAPTITSPHKIIDETLKQEDDDEKSKTSLLIDTNNLEQYNIKMGKCCLPLPGDKIIGFITKGKGIIVHTDQCKQYKVNDIKKLAQMSWKANSGSIPVKLEVQAYDIQGIYLQIIDAISKTGTNILEASGTSMANVMVARFVLEIIHRDELKEISEHLLEISEVIDVERIRH